MKNKIKEIIEKIQRVEWAMANDPTDEKIERRTSHFADELAKLFEHQLESERSKLKEVIEAWARYQLDSKAYCIPDYIVNAIKTCVEVKDE